MGVIRRERLARLQAVRERAAHMPTCVRHPVRRPHSELALVVNRCAYGYHRVAARLQPAICEACLFWRCSHLYFYGMDAPLAWLPVPGQFLPRVLFCARV